MRSTFCSPKEYRDFAAQCLRWAARAKHEEHKNMMLQMADHWMQPAQELEHADTYRCVPSGARLASTPRDPPIRTLNAYRMDCSGRGLPALHRPKPSAR